MIWLLPHPSPLSRQQVCLSVFLCVAVQAYWQDLRLRGGEGVGEEPNHRSDGEKALSSTNHAILSDYQAPNWHPMVQLETGFTRDSFKKDLFSMSSYLDCLSVPLNRVTVLSADSYCNWAIAWTMCGCVLQILLNCKIHYTFWDLCLQYEHTVHGNTPIFSEKMKPIK